MEQRESCINDIKKDVSIIRYLEGAGVDLKRAGAETKCKCPIPDHKDTDASFYINEKENVFMCHGCQTKGSIIDLVVAIDCCSVGDAVKKLEEFMGGTTVLPAVEITKTDPDIPYSPPILEGEHVYTKPDGTPVFFVQRFRCHDGGKTFRQGHFNEQGGKIMSMTGVERLPYNLIEFGNSDAIWLAEGEKCADALCSVGLVGTATVGGSGNWLDSYKMYFEGKDVVILPDFDDAGDEYAKAASESLKTVARTVRVLKLGSVGMPKGYDVADFIKELDEEFLDEDNPLEMIKIELNRRMEAIIPSVRGFELNISSINDMKRIYLASRQNLSGNTFSISEHLPSLDGVVRDFRTGDCICVKGPTGSAKTMFLQNIARWARPMNVLIFEPELPRADLFERWMAMDSDEEMKNVHERITRIGDIGTEGLDHVYVCPCTRPTPNFIEETVNKAELIIGKRPDMVMVDYIQLVHADEKCTRYERFSNVAEAFRVLPNNTRTIFFFISQVHRPDPKGKADQQPSKYDGKESGSIENSSTLMLDIREGENDHEKIITIVKDTHSDLEGENGAVGFIGAKGKFCPPFGEVQDVF